MAFAAVATSSNPSSTYLARTFFLETGTSETTTKRSKYFCNIPEVEPAEDYLDGASGDLEEAE